ncbi:MAG: ankyrin repeat protein [Alteromonas naphthalenivorans]|jgi:ankyrin repeat protein
MEIINEVIKMELIRKKIMLALVLFSTVSSIHTADILSHATGQWIPSTDGFEYYPDATTLEEALIQERYHNNKDKPELSGINIDCDDLYFCNFIKNNDLNNARLVLPFTSPEALNIASIEATPILVWLIKNNENKQYTKLILQLINTPGFNANRAHHIKKETPFQVAVKFNADSQILHALANYQDAAGQTLLHHAAFSTHVTADTVRTLLLAGANPTIQDDFGFTALQQALAQEDNEKAMIILNNGGKVVINTPNDYGDTPLHTAARYATPETIAILLANGANQTLLNKDGKKPEYKSIKEEV